MYGAAAHRICPRGLAEPAHRERSGAFARRAVRPRRVFPNGLVWWSNGPRLVRMLNEGEVLMSMAWNGCPAATPVDSARVSPTPPHQRREGARRAETASVRCAHRSHRSTRTHRARWERARPKSTDPIGRYHCPAACAMPQRRGRRGRSRTQRRRARRRPPACRHVRERVGQPVVAPHPRVSIAAMTLTTVDRHARIATALRTKGRPIPSNDI